MKVIKEGILNKSIASFGLPDLIQGLSEFSPSTIVAVAKMCVDAGFSSNSRDESNYVKHILNLAATFEAIQNVANTGYRVDINGIQYYVDEYELPAGILQYFAVPRLNMVEGDLSINFKAKVSYSSEHTVLDPAGVKATMRKLVSITRKRDFVSVEAVPKQYAYSEERLYESYVFDQNAKLYGPFDMNKNNIHFYQTDLDLSQLFGDYLSDSIMVKAINTAVLDGKAINNQG